MARLSIKYITLCLVLILSSFMLTSCSESEEITIGAILALTTGNREPLPISEELLKGMELALDSINENGGIRGRRLRLVYRDSTLDTGVAQSAFREIASQSPVAIITMYSHLSKAVTPLATELKIPQLAVMATDDSILKNSPFTYRYWPSASTEAQAMILIIKKLKIRKLGIINIDNGYGNAVTNKLIGLLNKNGIENRSTQYQVMDQALSQRLALMKDCDALQLTCFPDDMVEMVALLKNTYPDKPIVGPNGITSPAFSANPTFEGVYVNAPLIYNPAFPFAADVGRRFAEETNTQLSQFSAIGYDSINLLSQLMTKGGTSAEAVNAELEAAFVYPGLFGDVVKKTESHDFSFQLYPARILNKQVTYRVR